MKDKITELMEGLSTYRKEIDRFNSRVRRFVREVEISKSTPKKCYRNRKNKRKLKALISKLKGN